MYKIRQNVFNEVNEVNEFYNEVTMKLGLHKSLSRCYMQIGPLHLLLSGRSIKMHNIKILLE